MGVLESKAEREAAEKARLEAEKRAKLAKLKQERKRKGKFHMYFVVSRVINYGLNCYFAFSKSVSYQWS